MATACLQCAHDECIASTPLACHAPCMDALYLTVAAVARAAVAVLAWRALGKRQPLRPQLPYTKRVSLLTPAEQRFYRVLLQAVPHGMTAFVKVRLMDVVNVPDMRKLFCQGRIRDLGKE